MSCEISAGLLKSDSACASYFIHHYTRKYSMKRKSLFALTMVSLFSIHSSYALQIQKGHLISHKEWSTNNLVFSVKDVKLSTSLLNHLKAPKIGTNSMVQVIAEVDPMNGSVGVPMQLTGNNQIVIFNGSDGPQNYTYQYSMCVMMDSINQQCGYYQDSFELDAGGGVMTTQGASLLLTFNAPGTYATTTSTFVASDDDGSPYSSSADGVIQIS